MEVGIHANMCDYDTEKIADKLRTVFKKLAEALKDDYGGTIEHLWIDFELIESHSRIDGRPRFPFRFQKRISGSSNFGLPKSPDRYNVGHFSVRPNFSHLLQLPNHEIEKYCLNLIYRQLEVMRSKEKKLGGFNFELFRDKYVKQCESLGYHID